MGNRLLQMEVFVLAADLGSLAAAAARLEMSPQMAGRYLKDLEARLGTRLLVRSTRQQRLTVSGQNFLAASRAALASIVQAERVARSDAERPAGSVRVSAPAGIGGARLAAAIPGFLDRFPEARVTLCLDDTVVDLIAAEIDLAVRIGELVNSTLIARALPPYQLVLCAAPSYLATRGEPRHPADLATHQLIDFAFPSWPPAVQWTLSGRGERHPIEVGARLTVNDSRAVLEAVLVGGGIALVARMLAAPHLARGALVEVLPDFVAPALPLQIVYRHAERRRPGAARAGKRRSIGQAGRADLRRTARRHNVRHDDDEGAPDGWAFARCARLPQLVPRLGGRDDAADPRSSRRGGVGPRRIRQGGTGLQADAVRGDAAGVAGGLGCVRDS